MEQCDGHPHVEVDGPFWLQHEVVYNLTTKRGMAAKYAICVEARVDHRLGGL